MTDNVIWGVDFKQRKIDNIIEFACLGSPDAWANRHAAQLSTDECDGKVLSLHDPCLNPFYDHAPSDTEPA